MSGQAYDQQAIFSRNLTLSIDLAIEVSKGRGRAKHTRIQKFLEAFPADSLGGLATESQ